MCPRVWLRLEYTLLGLLRPSPSWLIDLAKVRQYLVGTPRVWRKKSLTISGDIPSILTIFAS